MKPTAGAEPVNKDLSDRKPPANQLVTPDFNYKKLPEVIKLDKAPNQAFPASVAGAKSSPPNVKPWPSILNLDPNGYPITNWNDYYNSYNAYVGALNSLNNNPQNAMNTNANPNANPNLNGNANSNLNGNGNANTNQNANLNGLNSKDFNALLWQMLDPNQQKSAGTSNNLFDSLTSNIQQQQLLQSLFNKQFSNWLDNSNKNTAALSYLNYLQTKQQQNKQGKPVDRLVNPTNRAPIEPLKPNVYSNPSDRANPISASNPINKLDKGPSVASIGKPSGDQQADSSAAASSTAASIPASNLNKARYVSYDFKQPFVQYNGRDDYYPDENEQDNNSAVIALVLGLFITILLIVIVGYRMSSIKKRIQLRGGRTLAHDSDYLVNGLYL